MKRRLALLRLINVCSLSKGIREGLIDKVMHQARLMKAHFMLSRMNIDVNMMRIELDKKHIRRKLFRLQAGFVALTNRMIDELVAHHAPIDVAILQIALCTRALWRRDPAMQFESLVLQLNLQHVAYKTATTDRCNTLFRLRLCFRGSVLFNQLAVVAQVDRDIKTAQRDAFEQLIDMGKLSFLGTKKLATRRGIEKQI